MRDYQTIHCEPMQLNRINGYVINDEDKHYLYVGYMMFHRAIRELILNHWDSKLIDDLIHDNIAKKIVLIGQYVFEAIVDCDLCIWYIMDGVLHIYLSQAYPYVYGNYRYIRLFDKIIESDLAGSWFQLTKYMNENDLDDMKRMLLALYI